MFKCDSCSRTFSRRQACVNHQKQHERQAQDIYTNLQYQFDEYQVINNDYEYLEVDYSYLDEIEESPNISDRSEDFDQNSDMLDFDQNNFSNPTDHYNASDRLADFDQNDFSNLTDHSNRSGRSEAHTIDLRTNSLIDVFPNDTYSDFMILVTKHRLSDAIVNDFIKFFNTHSALLDPPLPTNAKAGRDYLNRINIPYIQFSTSPVLVYDNEQYELRHRSIYDSIKELLIRKEVLQYCEFGYHPKQRMKDGSLERIYGEQFSAEKWGEAQQSIPSTAKVLSIILYADATICDRLGNASEHPVYLTLGSRIYVGQTNHVPKKL